jgi:UDP-GlcNAc:undecaprenyl-phosphate GlcNAc-1-phosphate transferase
MTGLLPPYILYLLAVLVSFVISMYSVKKILFITMHRQIFDTPDNIRKIHGANIPSLGGIGIFIGYIVAASFFINASWFSVIAASVILFFTGIYDDLMNMVPSKKLLSQLITSGLAVYFADIRITDLHGLFGITELPYWGSIGLTTFCCTFFINVFNFVDGIDGLACFMAILYTGILGGLFATMGDISMAGICFGLAGATMGLLYYNRAPAKIYMGDTGSMLLGFSIFLLSVFFIHAYPAASSTAIVKVIHTDTGAMIFIIALLFLPMYDALRVFALRTSRGISPLKADRTHLHYYLLDAGLGHSAAVLVIMLATIAIIALGYLMQDANLYVAVGGMTLFASAFLFVVYRSRQKKLES